MEKYNKNKFFSSLILLLFILTSSLKLNAQIITIKYPVNPPSTTHFNEGETITFSIENYIVSNNIYAYDILWDVVGSADYDINQMDGYDFEVTWNEYSVGSNIKITVDFYNQPNQQGTNYYQETGWITISPTGINWYPDSDGDGFGNFNAEYIRLDSSITPHGYAQNNLDNCPYFYSTENNGCGTNYENRNWITSKAYDINGTLKASSKSYFDDLGKGIQSQSVDIKTSKTWAASILYDAQGRPALSTLSAPINSLGTFTYKPDFIRDSGNATYNNADFETNPLSPTPIGTTSNTLGAYYSPNNTGEPYQDITSYPFSRTIYSELNPGAGLKAIGGNKQEGEWKQGYTFSMPAGQELSKSVAFGDPAYDDIKTIKTISKDVHGTEVVMFTDTDGKTLGAARVGGTSVRNTTVAISEQGYVDVHVPTNTTGFTISGVSGINTQVYNLKTEQTTATATSSLTTGFYRISITNLDAYNPSTNAVTITCKENYYDYSLNEYDDVGRLIASYQPVGATKAQKPVTTYNYNALGQLVSTTSPDEGTANFKYRKDGQIRFSQNSKQLANTEFSYTNYDDLGRPIESGVVQSANFNSADADSSSSPSGTKKEQQFTKYDYVETSDKTYLTSVHSSYGNPTFLSGNVAKTSNDHTTTYYSYDVYGRVKWIVQNISGLGAKTIDYEYDPVTGSVKKVDYQKNTSTDRFIHRYTYHAVDNSLIKVETSANGGTSYTTHADYTYYETGALKRVEIAKIAGTPLQGIDYVYNLSGQLKSINHPSLTAGNDPGGDSNDLFGMQIDYNQDDYERSLANITSPSYGQDQFNGNIKGIRWNNKELENSEKTYSYYYNKNNWLSNAVYGQYGLSGGDGSKLNIMDDAVYETGTTNLNATKSITLLPGFHAKSGTTLTAKIVTGSPSSFQSGDYNVFDITYDANGNIRTLNRNKHTVSSQNKMDQLGYVYNPAKPNQLVRVDDAAGQVLPGNDIGDQDGTNYEYNQIGQMVKNNEEGLEYVYNARGLVTEVKKNNVSLVKFSYNDRGHRVKKEIFNSGGSLTRTDYYVRDASGSVMAIYENATAKEYPIYGASRLGIFNKTGESSYYQLTDHLGNVRAVTGRAQNGTPLAIVATTDYYPFGMPMPNRNVEGNYRFKYQGQEKDPETGMEAFELRLWDSRIGRWLSVDPYGQFYSPYLGMGNNPVSVVDPDGGFACVDAETGLSIPCPDSHQSYGATMSAMDAYFDKDKNFLYTTERNFNILETVNLGVIHNKIDGNIDYWSYLGLALKGSEYVNIGKLVESGKYRMYVNSPYSKSFSGNQYTNLFELSKKAKVAGYVYTYGELGYYGIKAVLSEGKERDEASSKFLTSGSIAVISYYVPQIGVVYLVSSIIAETETWQQAVHDARFKNAESKPFGTLSPSIQTEIRQGDGLRRDSNGRIIN